MPRAALIGVDVGTTSVKAILIGLDGKTIATFSKAYPTTRPQPGRVEQNPNDWTERVLAALRAFVAEPDLEVVGIGFCSQVNTHVFVDDAGEPVMPAIVWQDTRCGDAAAALDRQVTPEQKARWFGGPMPIDASHALSRIAYVAARHSDLYQRTRWVLLPKDYCALKLTGIAASDPISAVGLVGANLRYVEELIAMVPGAGQRLPPLRDFTDRVGTVAAGLPFAGVPVFAGVMDAWAGFFGIGVTGERDAGYLSGTSEVLGIVSSAHVPTPGVIVFPERGGIRLHAAPTQSGGASLEWASQLLGRAPGDLADLAGATKPSPAVPVFLPHLEGERAPLWDPKSRGVFARLGAASGAGEIARAVLEGVAFSARLAFEATEMSAGLVAASLNLGGGGARFDGWCQIRADALGKTLRRVKVLDAGTLGAAIIAGLGSGSWTSLASAAERLVAFERSFEPDPSLRSYYDDRFQNYRRLYEDLKAFNAGYS